MEPSLGAGRWIAEGARKILAANKDKIDDPNKIKPGLELKTPS